MLVDRTELRLDSVGQRLHLRLLRIGQVERVRQHRGDVWRTVMMARRTRRIEPSGVLSSPFPSNPKSFLSSRAKGQPIDRLDGLDGGGANPEFAGSIFATVRTFNPLGSASWSCVMARKTRSRRTFASKVFQAVSGQDSLAIILSSLPREATVAFS